MDIRDIQPDLSMICQYSFDRNYKSIIILFRILDNWKWLNKYQPLVQSWLQYSRDAEYKEEGDFRKDIWR